MEQRNQEIHDNHAKNLPHGLSIADRPVDHQDFAPMMTKAQLANKSDIKDLGEGKFEVTGTNFILGRMFVSWIRDYELLILANGKTMNIVDETGYKRMPSPLERMIFAGNKYQSTDMLNKYIFLPGVVGGICYAFYSFISGFGNQKLTALQQAKKMNGRVNGKITDILHSNHVFHDNLPDGRN